MELRAYDNRIRRIAMFGSMKLGMRVLAAILGLEFVIFTIQHSWTATPVLILFFLIFAPEIAEGIMKEPAGKHKADEEDILPNLSHKYGYTDGAYRRRLAVFVLTIGLLLVWEYSADKSADPIRYIYPMAGVVGMLGTYLVRSFIITRQIRKDLLEGKL